MREGPSWARQARAYWASEVRREAERHYQVLEDHLAGRDYFVGNSYTIADMSTWGWIDRASRVLKVSGALIP